MISISTGISIAGFMLVLGSWVFYMATVPKMKVPVKPTGHLSAQSLGLVLALFAVYYSFANVGQVETGVIPFAAIATMMSGLFFGLYSIRNTPVGNIKVKVGDSLLAFSATSDTEETFNTDELSGKRVLLKFFRGGW
ncbi:MAG: hypothetical protein GY786_04530 [Proteobacteria bacterium]|nr:hypothetical protein [Pseudomonadota bacterium]